MKKGMEPKEERSTTTTPKNKQRSPSHHKKPRGTPRFVRSAKYGRSMLQSKRSGREKCHKKMMRERHRRSVNSNRCHYHSLATAI